MRNAAILLGKLYSLVGNYRMWILFLKILLHSCGVLCYLGTLLRAELRT